MRSRMPGDVEHREREAELGNAHRVAFADRMRERGDGLALRPVDRHAAAAAGALEDLRDAAHVVGMVVRGEDGGELQPLALEVLEHRVRLAGIHDGCVARLAQRPDVVVL